MNKLRLKSSTILFFIIIVFLLVIFISYELLLRNIQNNHQKDQLLTFNLIQRESSNLLTKLLYSYSKQKNLLLDKHLEVLKYLETNSYDESLENIFNKINDTDEKLYNIYITNEDLVITNTTYKPDLGFNLSFAKDIFEKHKQEKMIGISSPVFEMHSLKFFSFTDSYLPNNQKRVLQVSYTYDDLTNDLEKLQKLINENKNIKDSNAYLIFNDGYIGDFIFKSLKSHKPSLEQVNKRIEDGRKLANSINEREYVIRYLDLEQKYKIHYFLEKSPIYDEAKIIYSITFDESKYNEEIKNLNIVIILISLIGIITIYIIFRLRGKENLLKYKDKFIEHSVHEIKTPLSVIKLNNQLRKKNIGEDKYTTKIEGATKSLEVSYEDMIFLHTKDKINYFKENLLLNEILKERVKYFEDIAISQNRILVVNLSNDLIVNMSNIELIRLIDNNLSNAIKYSNIGSNVYINIKNNSLGFISLGAKINNPQNIFNKYTRENNIVGGHGLGLSIVRDICTKYHILINVYSSNIGENKFLYEFKGV